MREAARPPPHDGAAVVTIHAASRPLTCGFVLTAPRPAGPDPI
jgi:hypothetical protein